METLIKGLTPFTGKLYKVKFFAEAKYLHHCFSMFRIILEHLRNNDFKGGTEKKFLKI
ncbi:MAG: hypothetical protein P1P61_02555 [Treponemataceae bacterium]